MTFILRLAKVGLRFLYLFLRPLPLKNKIVFFSRQSSTIPLDFTLLTQEIQKQSPETEIVYFCRKMRRKTKVFSYCCFILHSLYHLATASIAVTDTYSIQLCVLHPKRGQTVVQVWHAVGAVKQFSYQCLDKPGGQPAALAKAMEMHKNYDYVFCTSEATADIYAQGFQMPREQILPLGMPRVDYLRETGPALRARHLEARPELAGKQICLYLPTFRAGVEVGMERLMDAFSTVENAVLLIKPHPMSKITLPEDVSVGKGWSTYEMMKVADCVITDYSAASLEVSLLNKPVYLYLYDYDAYTDAQGLNIDLWKAFPHAAFRTAAEVAQAVQREDYDWAALQVYRETYIQTAQEDNTGNIVRFLLQRIPEHLRKQREPAEV